MGFKYDNSNNKVNYTLLNKIRPQTAEILDAKSCQKIAVLLLYQDTSTSGSLLY